MRDFKGVSEIENIIVRGDKMKQKDDGESVGKLREMMARKRNVL